MIVHQYFCFQVKMYKLSGGRKVILNMTAVATKKKISSFEGEVGRRIL
jgi:hypothetical protein